MRKALEVDDGWWARTRGLQCFKLNGNQTRIIDIGKKITFYFLQNFWKCTVFFSFAFEVSKKCYQKIFFLKNINMGIKKRRILCWFQIRCRRLKQIPLKKARAKKLLEFRDFRFCAFFHGFLLLTFVRGISESRHQRIWNQHKILRFFDIFQQKIFWVIIALFGYFKCKCEKNCTFSNI